MRAFQIRCNDSTRSHAPIGRRKAAREVQRRKSVSSLPTDRLSPRPTETSKQGCMLHTSRGVRHYCCCPGYLLLPVVRTKHPRPRPGCPNRRMRMVCGLFRWWMHEGCADLSANDSGESRAKWIVRRRPSLRMRESGGSPFVPCVSSEKCLRRCHGGGALSQAAQLFMVLYENASGRRYGGRMGTIPAT